MPIGTSHSVTWRFVGGHGEEGGAIGVCAADPGTRFGFNRILWDLIGYYGVLRKFGHMARRNYRI